MQYIAQTDIAAPIVVLALIILDYVTGLAKAIVAKNVSSEKMRLGLWHKASLIVIIVLAEILERAQAIIDFGYTVPLIIPACVYIALMEITSILENLSKINPELQNTALLQLFRSTKTVEQEPKHKKTDDE